MSVTFLKPKVRLTVEAVPRNLDEYMDLEGMAERLADDGHQIVSVSQDRGTIFLAVKEADNGQ
jgi:hypothetical protein